MRCGISWTSIPTWIDIHIYSYPAYPYTRLPLYIPMKKLISLFTICILLALPVVSFGQITFWYIPHIEETCPEGIVYSWSTVYKQRFSRPWVQDEHIVWDLFQWHSGISYCHRKKLNRKSFMYRYNTAFVILYTALWVIGLLFFTQKITWKKSSS